jgi:nucleoside-diphosphate-sugar epimerase
MSQQKVLLCLGFGYSAAALAQRLGGRAKAGEWRILGTTRNSAKAAEMRRAGIEPIAAETLSIPAVRAAVEEATHLLHSAPPGADGDPAHLALGEAIGAARNLQWFGYLSTVGVYGDAGGAWVDEDSPLKAESGQALRRVEAEAAWRKLAETGLPLEIFRLSGIYGPGRSAFERLRGPEARIIEKPGQVFNRIHVADIAQVLEAAMDKPRAGAVYNLADDEPAEPGEVIRYAAGLLGVDPPPSVAFEEAELSPMAREFYSQVKRVANARIKQELGVELLYPTYREGLAAILDQMRAESAATTR